MSYISVAQYASSEDTKKTAFGAVFFVCNFIPNPISRTENGGTKFSAYNSPTWCYACRQT